MQDKKDGQKKERSIAERFEAALRKEAERYKAEKVKGPYDLEAMKRGEAGIQWPTDDGTRV